MAKASIKSKVKVEAKGIERMRAVAEARENVKAEVKWNGKGEMTLGLSAAECSWVDVKIFEYVKRSAISSDVSEKHIIVYSSACIE